MSVASESIEASLLPPRQTYSAAGVKHALHGTIYQLNILMLALSRGLNSSHPFSLATEMDEAGKFDDVVMICKDDHNNLIYHFLQAKHKQNDEDVITPNDLLDTKDGDFSLIKYFVSYRENLLKTKETYDNKIRPQSGSLIGDCILYTNARLCKTPASKEKLNFDTVLKPVKEPNFLIDNGEKYTSQKYRFNIKNHKAKLTVIYDTLKLASNLDMLAEHMASKVCNDDEFNKKDRLFQTWHVALANDVFDVKEKKFKETFIKYKLENTPVQELRRLFKQKLHAKMSKKKKDFDEYWKKFENGNIALKISKSFGTQLARLMQPQLANPEKTADALCGFLTDDTITIENKRAEALNREKLSQLAGHVIVKTDKTEKAPKTKFRTFYLSNAFKTGEPSDTSLVKFKEEFIKQIKEKCNHSEDVDISELLDNLKIKIKDFDTYEDGNPFPKLPEKLVDDVVPDDEIDTFLNHLIIAVNQPNELELYDIVQKEIGHDFRLLNSDIVASYFKKTMLDWFKDKHGYFLSELDAKSIFKEIGGILAHYVLIGPTLEYKARVEASNIQFNDTFDLDEMLRADKHVQCIVTKDTTWLSAIKLYSSLKSNERFKGSDDSFIISNIDTVINLRKQFESAFSWTENKTKLLIIEIDTVREKEKLGEILQFLKNQILPNKKLWFILSDEDQLDGVVNCFDECETITDSERSFQDFDLDTQTHLFNKTIQVKYQDHSAINKQRVNEICNANIIPTEMIKLLIDSDVDTSMLELSLPFQPLSKFEQNCYIHRTFKRFKVIDEGVLSSDDFKDMLVIVSNDKNFINEKIPETITLNKDTIDEENLSTQLSEFIDCFEGLNHAKKQELRTKRIILHCSKKEILVQLQEQSGAFLPERNIHFLKENNGILYWERTYGKLDALKKHITKDFNTCHENNFMPQHGIIAAEPGMGKTTVVNHMMAERLNQSTSTVLLKVDLHQHQETLNKMKFSTLEEGMKFFETAFSLLPLARYYFQQLLENRSNQARKLHIYFDGFDEIGTEEQSALCLFLEHLRKTSAGITVATRRHKTLELENALCTLAYDIQSISEDDQKTYLTEFWTKSIGDSEKKPGRAKPKNEIEESIGDAENKAKIRQFANALIEKFSKAMKDEQNAFMGIPLQLRLIAESFEDKCRAFCNDTEATEPNIKDEFNRVSLYQTLIDKKLQRFLRDKLSLGTWLSRGLQVSLELQISEAHKRLAFEIIFPDCTVSSRLFHSELFSRDEFNAIGLVEMRDNDTKFVHRTFGEYFIATKLVTLLQQPYSEYNQELKQFIFSKLFLDSSEIILRFMQDLINDLKDPTLQEQWNTLQKKKVQYQSDSSVPNKRSGSMNLYVKTTSSDKELDSNVSLKEKIDALNYMMVNNSNWDEVCIQVNDLYTFVQKYEFSVEQLNQVLDVMISATEKYSSGYPLVPKILNAIFIHLPEFSVKCIMKAYFPKPDKVMVSLNKLEKLRDISIPETCQTTNSGAIIDTTKPRNCQQEFATKLDEINQLNTLLEKNSAKENSDKVNDVRKQLCQKKDLSLLQQLKYRFPNIDYEISEDDEDTFTSVDPADLHYVCHSNNILTREQLKRYMGKVNDKQCRVQYNNWLDAYEQLFLNITPAEFPDLREFAVENNMASLLCRLKQNFPDTFDLSPQDFVNLFSKEQNEFLWRETEGIKLLVTYKVFNRKLLHKLCEKIILNGRINGFHTNYAEKIIENFIKPILREKSWSEFDRLAFLQCIQNFICFYVKRHSKIDFDDELFTNLFCLHGECFNDFTTDSTTLNYVANSLLFIIKETVNRKGDKTDSQGKGCILFKTDIGLMLVDPAGNFERSIELDNPDEAFDCIRSMFAKPDAAPDLDDCDEDIEKRPHKRYVVEKRRREVCSRENVSLMASDADQIYHFMRAVTNGSWHEAYEMIRKRRRTTV